MLTVREVADCLSVNRQTILRWTARGILPAIRLPSGALRYRESDLEDWIAERTVEATPVGDSASHLHEAPPER